MKKRALSLSLMLLMLLTACSGNPAPAQNDASAQASTESSASAEASAPAEASAAESTSSSTETVEPSGDIVVLYTSDVHCGVDQGFGYAGLAQVRSYLESQGDEVLLVDDGDSIQGEPMGTMTKGEAIIELMNAVQYDVAIPGNHEFDYGVDTFLSLTEKAQFPYISCNFNKEGELIFPPYVIKEAAGKKIAFVGVTTPTAPKTSTPKYFQDEKGNFIYNFMQDKSGEKLYTAVQSAVDAARAEGADYVYLMAHLGNEEACRPWTYEDVITHTNGIDVFFDGHSHDTDQLMVKNKDGKEIPRSACGTKLAAIGYSRISGEDGSIDTGLYTWYNDASVTDMLGVDNEVGALVRAKKSELDDKLNETVASTDVELTINDPTEKDSSGAPVRMVRRAETNLGDLCADAYRDQSGADIAFVNGGGIRACIDKGDITLGDILNVHPYGNSLCVIEVTGQQVLDALEWGAHGLPEENGGFLQVSGLTYEADSSVPTPCKADDEGMMIGIEGERRVSNVKVNGEDIDPEKTYTLASHDYMLLDHGDGFTCFDGYKLLQDRIKLDNQVLIDYVTETLGGSIGEEYADPYGQGRIVIK